MKTHPIFVLEGPDGVGKTTLAKAMCEKLGAKYLHLTYRFKNKMFTYHHAALEWVLTEAQKGPIVLDRWWLSEIAYANVYRNGTRWPVSKYLFESVALKHGFVYIICLPFNKQEYHDHFTRLKSERIEMYDDSMDRVYDEFKTMWNEYFSLRHSAMRYDWTEYPGGSIDRFIQVALEISEDNRICQYEYLLDRSFLNFTGHPLQGRFLLVGDRSNAKTRRPTWPFFEYGNSSLWLAETLDYLEVKPYSVMMTNANNSDQNATELLIRRAYYDGLKIIGMGVEASDYLSKINIPHRKITHPQYYKRFASNKGIHDLRSVFK